MRSMIRFCGFWYGCLGTVGALAWYVSAILGRAALPSSVWIVESVFGVHAVAMIFTFQRTPVRRPWDPMFPVTPTRIRMARLLLGLFAANFACCLGLFAFAVTRRNLPLGNRAVPLIVTSFLLLNTVYVALHWSFRPRNLFSSSLLRAVSNPLGLFPWGSKKNRST